MFDVIIIGGGVAGMSCAAWCSEVGLKSVVLEAANELGGQLLWTHNPIKNHLGAETENGREMRDLFVKQLEARDFDLKRNAAVIDVDLENKQVLLENGESIESRYIVIATGIRRRQLNIAGELKFIGKGILESGKRDARLVAKKEVCVIGGGDAALENALLLAKYAKKVWLVHRGAAFRARKEFIEEVSQNPKIEVLMNTKPTRILGVKKVEGIELKDAKEMFELPISAMVVRIGVAPNTEIFRGRINLVDGYLEINSNCETSVENVFAIGDVANPLAPTISSAVGHGATCAKVIIARSAQ